MKSIKLTHVSENGDNFVFSGDKPLLLGYCDLKKIKSNSIDMKFKVLASECTFNGTQINSDEGYVTVKNLIPKTKQIIYSLTLGGWLPFTFMNNSILLVDKNVIEYMHSISRGETKNPLNDIDLLLKHSMQNIIINPLLFALEGNKRKAQTFEEFYQSFEEAKKIITSYSPQFKVINYSENDYKEVYSLIENFHTLMERQIKFLCKVAPFVINDKKNDKLEAIEKEINKVAYELNVSNRLAHIAVLSVLYDSSKNKTKGDRPPARGLLKIGQNYSEQDAYNALSDLLNLEILLHLNRQSRVFFCTSDFSLAAFWVALDITDSSYNNEKFNIKFNTENLFSRSKGLISILNS